MGVPSLFRNIVEYDPKAYFWDPNVLTDHLYFDFNNLIHFCKNKNPNLTEEDLITEVIKYTSYITTKLIKPSKLVYISFDGPVPYGKMMRQRARRYKKVQDVAYKVKVYKKFNMEYYEKFDSNNISPGTSFMTKLSSRLRNFVNIGAFNSHVTENTRFNVIISDTSVPGEGEHKIFKFLKKSKDHSRCVIYGMDADLIILSMECFKNNIRLLREYEEDTSQFRLLDIDSCKNALLHIHDLNDHKYDSMKVIKDFVYFSFFGGNDFVMSFPSLCIRDNGLTYLFKCYKQLIDENTNCNNITYLLDNNYVPNGTMLYEFMKILVEHEHTALLKKINRIQYKSSYNNVNNTKKDKEDIVKELINNYEHSYYFSKQNPFNNYYQNILYAIDYNDNNWNKMYNDHFFSNIDLQEVCQNHLGVLKWCLDYYINNEPPSWYYYYKYRNAPTLNDFITNANFEKMSAYKYSLNYKLPDGINKDSSLTPYEQLLVIMPIQSMNILPKPFSPFVVDEDSPLYSMHKLRFKLDVLVGYKNIYSEPILDDLIVDFKKIKAVINNVILNDMEWSRNILRESPFKRSFGKFQNNSSY